MLLLNKNKLLMIKQSKVNIIKINMHILLIKTLLIETTTNFIKNF